MGVNTPLLTDGLGGEDSLGFRVVAAAAPVLEPDDVADAVVEGLARRALPDPPAPRGPRVLPAQGGRLRPLARRHAPPAGARRRRTSTPAAIDPSTGDPIRSPVRRRVSFYVRGGPKDVTRQAGSRNAGRGCGNRGVRHAVDREGRSGRRCCGRAARRPRASARSQGCRAAARRTARPTSSTPSSTRSPRPTRPRWSSRTRPTRASRAARSSTSRSRTTPPRSVTASPCSSTWAGSTATRRRRAEDSLEFAYDVLLQAKTNPKVKALLDKVRLIDMPLTNPDGHAFKNAARVPPPRAARAAVLGAIVAARHVRDHGRRPQPQLSVRLGLQHRRQPRRRAAPARAPSPRSRTRWTSCRTTRS